MARGRRREMRVARKRLGCDAEFVRAKARDVLAQADESTDRLIAAELKLLAERYLTRALELDDAARRRARRVHLTTRRRKARAGPRPSSGAYRGDI